MPIATLPATPLQVAPGLVLSQSDILSTASSIIQTYPSITSAYLYGSYAKGTARPDSDINIALFIPDHCDNFYEDIGGFSMDLERALNRVVDFSVCPPDDILKWIKSSWIPIHPHCGKPSDSSSETMLSSSDEIKERLREMELVCKDLYKYVDHVNSIGGVSKLDDMYEMMICDCVNYLGYSIKSRELGFDDELQKIWISFRVITTDHCHEHELSKVWVDFPMAMRNLFASIEAKLK